MPEQKARENHIKIFVSASELQSARIAAALANARSVSAYCRDVIVGEAERVIKQYGLATTQEAGKQRGKSAGNAGEKSQRR